MTDNTVAKTVFEDGLRNAHAMEKQALAIMQPQVNRLEHYPAVSEMLVRHIRETEGQIERLEQILESAGESASSLKDATLSFSGSMAAATHTMAKDEILKNSFANFAFEHFEIAAYTSLITSAEACGAGTALPLLQQNLDEEKRMAETIRESIPTVTLRFLDLSAGDQRADV